MDLSRFPLLAQQHARINSVQNLANKPLDMSDDEKLNLVVGFENANKFPSTIHPHIVIIEDGDGHLAYNIQTGDVTSLDSVNIGLIPLNDGTFKEARSFDVHEVYNGMGVITVSSQKMGAEWFTPRTRRDSVRERVE
jgi:hypothetical protein